jgi:hypothetical protein
MSSMERGVSMLQLCLCQCESRPSTTPLTLFLSMVVNLFSPTSGTTRPMIPSTNFMLQLIAKLCRNTKVEFASHKCLRQDPVSVWLTITCSFETLQHATTHSLTQSKSSHTCFAPMWAFHRKHLPFTWYQENTCIQNYPADWHLVSICKQWASWNWYTPISGDLPKQ